MYLCPNCGAFLKFDVKTQKMSCEYCDSRISVEDVRGSNQEQQEYETNVFTCTQCGGEIYTLDNDLTGFCSYCGANMTFSKRVRSMAPPQKIIPFKKTKEDCKKIYLNLLDKMPFVPADMKKEGHVDGFRGIYMPFWVYDTHQEGKISLVGERDYTKGDYDYHEEYSLSAQLDADYNGLVHDAADGFSDEISEAIAPFDMDRHQKPFSPAYLCGFYGEMQDVPAETYYPFVQEMTTDRTFKAFEESYQDLKIKKPDNFGEKVKTEIREPAISMLPVWFLSYRTGKRVNYATVNGETGKVSADIPVDLKSYFLQTAVIAAMVFVLLNFFISVKPEILMAITAWMAVCMIGYYNLDMQRMITRGYASLSTDLRQTMSQADEKLCQDCKKNYDKGGPFGKAATIIIIALIALLIMRFVDEEVYQIFNDLIRSDVFGTILSIVALVFASKGITKAGQIRKLGKKLELETRPHYIWAWIASLLAVIVSVIDPVSDLYYYAAAVVVILTVCITMVDLVNCHNMMTTRPLPQFRHTGGDDHE